MKFHYLFLFCSLQIAAIDSSKHNSPESTSINQTIQSQEVDDDPEATTKQIEKNVNDKAAEPKTTTSDEEQRKKIAEEFNKMFRIFSSRVKI